MKSKAFALFAVLFLMAACDEDSTPDDTNDDAGITDDDSGTKPDAGGSKDDQLGDSVVAKLKECKIASPQGEDDLIEDEYDRCSAKCVVAASCDTLRDFACDGMPMSSNTLFACFAKCPAEPADGHACTDGAKIPHVAVCDGFDDCNDTSDERACPEHTCQDGEKVTPADVKCDGFEDCSDGSDEVGCPAVCT